MDDVSCLQTPRDRVQCLDFGRQFSTLQVSFNASGIDIFSSSTLSVFFSLSRLDPPESFFLSRLSFFRLPINRVECEL